MVERNTVYEIYLQLYNEPYLPGMDWPDSRTYQNMSDQMIHLVRNGLLLIPRRLR